MEKKEKTIVAEPECTNQNNHIDRKEALKKAGKYAAFTALGMLVMLSPKQSQATSLPSGPGGFPY